MKHKTSIIKCTECGDLKSTRQFRVMKKSHVTKKGELKTYSYRRCVCRVCENNKRPMLSTPTSKIRNGLIMDINVYKQLALNKEFDIGKRLFYAQQGLQLNSILQRLY